MGVAQHSLHRINSCTETSSPSLIMPKGSGLTKPMKLSADLADIVGKKEASRAECSSNFGHTSRRTTFKTQKTNNSSPLTKRWLRFSAVTAFVPSVWPNSSHPTSPDKLVTYTRTDLYEPALSSPIILQIIFYSKKSTRRG